MPGSSPPQAAVERIDELEREYPGHLELIEHLRETYAHRAEHIEPPTARRVDEASRSCSSTARSGARSSTRSARR